MEVYSKTSERRQLMKWEAVKDDTYYRGRRLEMEARKVNDPEKWKAYAELKILKGSYALGIYGFMNEASLHEAYGDLDAAVAGYENALAGAMRAGYQELAVILTYRIANIYEKKGEWDACVAAYEELGRFCEEKGAHFLAADAYEHAAEMMFQAGRDVTRYNKPIEMWERNIKHWEEHGHEDDAAWSRHHIELYKKLFGVSL
jgi:tetratricopeptide (TPR) repeat protein